MWHNGGNMLLLSAAAEMTVTPLDFMTGFCIFTHLENKMADFSFVVAFGSSMRTSLLLTKSFLNYATFDLMLKLWVLCVWGVSVCRGECVWMCESFSEWQSKQSHWYRPPTLSNPNTQMYYGCGCAIRKQDYTYWPLLEVLYLVKSKICCWSFSCQSKSIVSLSFIVT